MNGKIVILVAALVCQAYAAPSFSFGGLLGGSSGANVNGGLGGQGSGLFTNMLRPQGAAQGLLNGFQDFAAKAQAGGRDIMNQIQGQVQDFINGLDHVDLTSTYEKVYDAAIRSTMDDLREQGKAILEHIQNFAGDFQKFGPDMISQLQAEIEKITGNFEQARSKLQEELQKRIEEVQAQIASNYQKFVEARQQGAEKLHLALEEQFLKIQENIKETVDAGQDNFKTFIGNLQELAKNYREEGTELAQDIAGQIQEFVKNAITDEYLPVKIETFFQNLQDGASSNIEEVADKYQHVIAEISGTANGGAMIANIREQIQLIGSEATKFIANFAKGIQEAQLNLSPQPSIASITLRRV